MFVSHLLATGEVKADHGTEANERREVEDEEDVLRHVAVTRKTVSSSYKDSALTPANQLAPSQRRETQTQLLVLVKNQMNCRTLFFFLQLNKAST